MTESADVAVVGGGIIGLTAAYFLSRAGCRVTVFERGEETGREASWAGAGILPPGNPDRARLPIDRLRALGAIGFPDLSAELRELTGLDNGYRRTGAIEFFDDTEARQVLPLWQAEGIRFTPVDRREWLTFGFSQELVASDRLVAYHLPDCAQVRNPWHLRALAAACRRLGVQIRIGTEVTGWLLHGRTVGGVRLATGEEVVAGYSLLAGGAWSERLLGSLGRPVGVHPVRGQIVLFRRPQPPLRPILMFGKRYFVPRDDGRVLVGSTEEPEAGFEACATAAGVLELLGFATRIFPDWSRAEVERAWAGLRPGSADGLPVIGAIPGYENVLVATGHFRAGVQLSIGTARLLTDLLTGRTPCVSPAAFAPDRTPEPGGPRAFRS